MDYRREEAGGMTAAQVRYVTHALHGTGATRVCTGRVGMLVVLMGVGRRGSAHAARFPYKEGVGAMPVPLDKFT